VKLLTAALDKSEPLKIKSYLILSWMRPSSLWMERIRTVTLQIKSISLTGKSGIRPIVKFIFKID
jgi:hypothetical protein